MRMGIEREMKMRLEKTGTQMELEKIEEMEMGQDGRDGDWMKIQMRQEEERGIGVEDTYTEPCLATSVNKKSSLSPTLLTNLLPPPRQCPGSRASPRGSTHCLLHTEGQYLELSHYHLVLRKKKNIGEGSVFAQGRIKHRKQNKKSSPAVVQSAGPAALGCWQET